MNNNTDEKTQSKESQANTLICTVPLNKDNAGQTILRTGIHIANLQKERTDTPRIIMLDTSRKTYGETAHETHRYDLPFEIDYGEDIGFIIGKHGDTMQQGLNALKEITKGYDHLIVANPDDLIFIHVSDNHETIDFKRTALLEVFNRLRFTDNDINLLTVSLIAPAHLKAFYEAVQNPVNGRILLNCEATADLPELKPTFLPSIEDHTGFFDETSITDEVPLTGVHRTDHILAQNQARWGDMIFFAAKESPALTRYAIDSIIPSAPIRVPVLHISPFRNMAEVKGSLKKLENFSPLSIKAIERTTIITSEHFGGKALDSGNILMDIIKEQVAVFRKQLDQYGIAHGLCLIDSVEMDIYGATLDYPSLRWLAKANNILIIIGADKAEERYTFDRNAMIEKKTQKQSKNPMLSQSVDL